MRIEGKLTQWNDDRGFGFITPTEGSPKVFVHISSFPKDGRRPAIGERILFDVETDSTGKKRASNLLCPDRPSPRRSSRPASRPRSKPGNVSRILIFMVIAVLAAYGYNKFSHPTGRHALISPRQDKASNNSNFHCDGRTRCPEMTSCEEALFFLQHCPTVQMDGDGDGIPCERQWCN